MLSGHVPGLKVCLCQIKQGLALAFLYVYWFDKDRVPDGSQFDSLGS